MPQVTFTVDIEPAKLAELFAVLGGGAGCVAPAKGGKGKKADDAAASTPAVPTTPVVVAPVPPDSQATTSPTGKTAADLRAVVVDASSKITVPVVVQILQSVAGVQKASLVSPDKFDAVIAAIAAKVAESEIPV